MGCFASELRVQRVGLVKCAWALCHYDEQYAFHKLTGDVFGKREWKPEILPADYAIIGIATSLPPRLGGSEGCQHPLTFLGDVGAAVCSRLFKRIRGSRQSS